MRFFRFGEGISPIVHGNHLVIQNDHEGQSYIVVLTSGMAKNSGEPNATNRVVGPNRSSSSTRDGRN